MEYFLFYPADFSFVCPTESGDMQEHCVHLGIKFVSFTLFQKIVIVHKGRLTLQ